ncbi:phosphatase PAP2 family protein [Salegentibacter sp. F188]|uniref:Phosphatase PAP2 family protein n=1 Tax=Autumnicola patrickiae TaxID=3075591 RepID=A0ABU3E0C9_9FLAO|nr:phosphatase PAP2 family protein [Salegentibacter sp. F188]MDT0689441.1 phosphatase PAP2 family protein [Salegentibacter sp. F188]
MWDKLTQWDRELFVYLNSLGIESHDNFWIFVTQPENWIPLHILFFILFFIAYYWRKAVMTSLFLLATVGTTLAFTNLVKGIAIRLRPNNNPDLMEIIRILQEPTNYSFFSGHASTSFAAVTFIVLVLREKFSWIYLGYIWPLLFVLSRIFVGVHYPSDIIVGAFVGVIMAFLFFWAYQKSGKRFAL